MVKDIIVGEQIFAQKAEEATKEDMQIGIDLVDTLKHNINICLGMAANMIGENKRIIVFTDENNKVVLMYNPKMIKHDMIYITEEGCLSLEGNRKVKRYKTIKVEYLNDKFEQRVKTFKSLQAEVIQHQLDHLDGIVI